MHDWTSDRHRLLPDRHDCDCKSEDGGLADRLMECFSLGFVRVPKFGCVRGCGSPPCFSPTKVLAELGA